MSVPIPVGITGVGSYLPPGKLDNARLAKLYGCSEEWIVRRTGIHERRFVDKGLAASDLGVEAGRRALENAELDAGDVDLLVCATYTPDMSFPSTACLIQDRLGTKGAAAFDLQAACTGFVYALITAVQFVATGLHRNVLVVASDVNSSIVNLEDRKVAALFGDGAGAAVVSHSRNGGGVLGQHLGADGAGGKLFSRPAGGSRMPPSPETVANGLHFIHMDGPALFRFGVDAMVRASLHVLEEAGHEVGDVDLFIPHQANRRMIDAGLNRLGIPPEKTVINLDRFANTSAATIPIALHEAITDGRLQENDLLLMTGFGAGVTWGSILLRWDGTSA